MSLQTLRHRHVWCTVWISGWKSEGFSVTTQKPLWTVWMNTPPHHQGASSPGYSHLDHFVTFYLIFCLQHIKMTLTLHTQWTLTLRLFIPALTLFWPSILRSEVVTDCICTDSLYNLELFSVHGFWVLDIVDIVVWLFLGVSTAQQGFTFNPRSSRGLWPKLCYQNSNSAGKPVPRS